MNIFEITVKISGANITELLQNKKKSEKELEELTVHIYFNAKTLHVLSCPFWLLSRLAHPGSSLEFLSLLF